MAEGKEQAASQRRPRKRLAKRERAVRDLRIIESLTAGLGVNEVALKEGITPQWARKRMAAMLEERPIDSPRQFIHLQIRRLSEALLVSYTEMNGGNLQAVDRVVKVVRELDRYHGFGPAPAAPRSEATQLIGADSAVQPAAPRALAPPTQTALADLQPSEAIHECGRQKD